MDLILQAGEKMGQRRLGVVYSDGKSDPPAFRVTPNRGALGAGRNVVARARACGSGGQEDG